MKQILFATGNPSKVKRFSEGLLKNGIEVLTLEDVKKEIAVDENGNNCIENALIKARAYSKVVDMPVFAMDDTLYLENVPDEAQPKTHVRRVNGKRLSDEEMLKHYTELVKKYGKDEKIDCKWIYGMAVICNGKESTYTWTKGGFYITDKLSNKIHPGYPLDTISVNKELNKYFTDITKEDKEKIRQDESDVIEFITKNIG